MKNIPHIISLFLSLGSLFLPVSLFSKTIEVCADCPQTSIKSALEIAEDGDVIEIQAGHYFEHGLVVDKQIHLKGINWPVIDGKDQGEIITIIASNVSVEGLVIQNVGTSYLKDHAGLRIKRQRNCLIQNNKFLNTFFGIYLERAQDCQILNNELIGEAKNESSSGNAIHAWHCKNLLVEKNLVLNHRDGIYFEFVDSSQVQNNKSSGNLRYGLHFMFSNNDQYFDNTFEDNGAGVAVMFSKKIDMWNNVFQFNWGTASYGLLLKEIYDARIENNQFVSNTIGINIEGSTRIQYRKNNFRRNGWAIKMAGGCLDNNFTENNFLSNTLDLVLNSNVNNNTFNGNYWSEYSGYDLDKDEVGDIPHRPVKLFSFILDRTPESIVLLRSFFVDLLNFAEKVSPVFTPAEVLDHQPLMKPTIL